jgi:hypothetical protein
LFAATFLQKSQFEVVGFQSEPDDDGFLQRVDVDVFDFDDGAAKSAVRAETSRLVSILA